MLQSRLPYFLMGGKLRSQTPYFSIYFCSCTETEPHGSHYYHLSVQRWWWQGKKKKTTSRLKPLWANQRYLALIHPKWQWSSYETVTDRQETWHMRSHAHTDTHTLDILTAGARNQITNGPISGWMVYQLFNCVPVGGAAGCNRR